MGINIAIITNNPPVKEDVLAWGMCKVNSRLFRSLGDNVKVIFSSTQNGMYGFKDLNPNLKSKCILYDRRSALYKILSRYLGGKFVLDNNILYGKKELFLKYLKKNDINWLFCPCGVDPNDLKHGVYLSKVSGIPLAAYLVDDFKSGAVLSDNSANLCIAENEVPNLLNSVDKVFVISDGFEKHLKDEYGVKSAVLPLPYYSVELPAITYGHNSEIMFAGNISHFYIDGLREMAGIVDQINDEYKLNLTLRFTIPDIDMVKNQIGDFKCLSCKTCENDAQLYTEISKSMISYIPYSFDEKYKVMIATSFPSKTLDYLYASRFILIYAPEYANSTKYFRDNGIDQVISSHDLAELKRAVIEQYHKNDNYSLKYRTILMKNHNPNLISQIIMDSLSEKQKEEDL